MQPGIKILLDVRGKFNESTRIKFSRKSERAKNRRMIKNISFLILAVLIIFSSVNFVLAQAEIRTLSLSQPFEREIKGGEKHLYSVHLETNQTAVIEMQQKAITLSIITRRPDGAADSEIEIAQAQYCSDKVLVIANSAGDYKLEVFTTAPNARLNSYVLTLSEIRASNETDAKQNALSRDITALRKEADKLEKEATAESRPKAIEKLKAIVELAKQKQDRCTEANSLAAIGRIQKALGNHKDAVPLLEESVSIWTNIGNKMQEAIVRSSLGYTYYALSNDEKAIVMLDKAIVLAREIKERRLEAVALTNRALVYESENNVAKAVEYYEQTLAIFIELKNRFNEATVLHNLANLYYTLSANLTALDYAKKALEVSKEIGEKDVTQTLNLLGLIHMEMGDANAALSYFKQTGEIAVSLGDKKYEAIAIENTGKAYAQLGEPDKALSYLSDAYERHKKLGFAISEGSTAYELGVLYRNLGEYDKALEWFFIALSLQHNATNQKRDEPITLNSIGEVYEEQGNLTQARRYYQQSVALAKEVNDESCEAIAYTSLGNLELKQNNYAHAAQFFTNALQVSRRRGQRRREAMNLSNLGLVSLKQGDKQKALDYSNEAVNILRELKDPAAEAHALYRRALVYQESGDLREARKDIETALNYVETRRGKIPEFGLRASYFATVQEYYDFEIENLLRLHEANPNQRLDIVAFETSERARARSLLEMLQEAKVDVREGANAALLQTERNFINRLKDKASERERVVGAETNKAKADELKNKFDKEIASLSEQLENLRSRIRSENPRYAALSQATSLSAAEAQKLLDDKTVLLEYRLGKKRSFLWLVTKDEIKTFSLSQSSDIETMARAFYESLGTSSAANNARAAELSKELGVILLQPVASSLEGKRVAIVADGVLQYIPFAALTHNQKFFVEANEVVMLPSVSVLAELRREQVKDDDRAMSVAVFADPVFESRDPRIANSIAAKSASTKSLALRNVMRDFGKGENLPRLLFSREEARNILTLVQKENAFLRTDFEASRENVTENNLATYKILHFATHGLFDASRPELSGMVFSLYDKNGKSQDGFLRLNQIYNLKLPVDMVVLSACQTALGKDVKGEGLIGLTRGFMYAGSKRIVASLWKVDDAATAELMKHFYKAMTQEKLPPSESLRFAQLQLSKQKRWQSPYYWAAFTIQGEWR